MVRPKGIPHSEEHKKYMSLRMKGVNLGKICSTETKQKLIENNINFIHLYNFNNKFVCDFAIPEKNIVIECDGDYWHNLKNIKNQDKSKNAYIQTCGWKIIRFWEHDIHNNIDNCIEKIKKEIGDY